MYVCMYVCLCLKNLKMQRQQHIKCSKAQPIIGLFNVHCQFVSHSVSYSNVNVLINLQKHTDTDADTHTFKIKFPPLQPKTVTHTPRAHTHAQTHT